MPEAVRDVGQLGCNSPKTGVPGLLQDSWTIAFKKKKEKIDGLLPGLLHGLLQVCNRASTCNSPSVAPRLAAAAAAAAAQHQQ